MARRRPASATSSALRPAWSENTTVLPVPVTTDWARARVFLGERVALDVQLATHDRDAIFRDLAQLTPDDAYRAMRLLLEKAERAIAAQRAGAAHGPRDLVVEAADLASGAPGGPLSLVFPSGIDPIAEARVALAEERIRAADAAGPRGDSQAFLALADLSASERKALAVRLRHPPLGLGSISDEIDAIAAMSDDASALQRAIQRAFHAAQVRGCWRAA